MGSIADVFISARLENNKSLESDIVKSASKAGDEGAKSFGARFKAGLAGLKASIGASFSSGLGIGAGIGVFNLAERAIGAAFDALKNFAQAAREDDADVAHLTTALRANVPGWDGTTAAIDDRIDAGQRLAFTDDAIRDSMAQLVTRTHDINKALDLQSIAMDLARLKQIDLATATTLIGKAYSGNFTALQRMGIQIAKGSTATQALAQIQKQAAGQAKAYGDSEAGIAESVNIAMSEIGESIGRIAMPLLKAFSLFMRDVVLPTVKGLVDGLGNLGDAFNNLHRWVDPALAATQDFEKATRAAATAAGLDADAVWAYVESQKAKAEAERQAAIDADASVAFSEADRKARLAQAQAQIDQQVAQYGLTEAERQHMMVVAGIIEDTATVTALTEEQKTAQQKATDALAAYTLAMAHKSFATAQDTITQGAANSVTGKTADALAAAAVAYQENEKIVSTANNVMVRSTSQSNQAIVAEYRALPGGIAAALQATKGAVSSAMKDLRFAIEHPMAVAHERAKLEALLTGKDLAKGLRSTNPEIRAAAENAKATILAQLDQLPGRAGADGSRTANAWISAFARAIKASIGGQGELTGALDHMYAIFAAHSPPKEGPFHHIDKDGERLGNLVGLSIAKGIRGTRGKVSDALGGLASGFVPGGATAGMTMPSFAMAGPDLGSLGAGTIRVMHDVNVHSSDGSVTRDVVGPLANELGGYLRDFELAARMPTRRAF